MKDIEDEEVDRDLEYSKETYRGLIDLGQEGIEEMLVVAKNSEHPRAYEVLSKLIKDVADVTDKLMDANRKHKDIKYKKREADQSLLPAPNATSQTNIFVGSTAELQKMLIAQEKDITPNGDN